MKTRNHENDAKISPLLNKTTFQLQVGDNESKLTFTRLFNQFNDFVGYRFSVSNPNNTASASCCLLITESEFLMNKLSLNNNYDVLTYLDHLGLHTAACTTLMRGNEEKEEKKIILHSIQL